jgi:Amt family ammonium transporter
VGALSAHGLAGVWGTLACGLFTNPALAKFNAVGDGGLVYTGSFHQLLVQGAGVAIVFTGVFVSSYVVFGIIKATYGMRVSDEEELAGLDISEHGMYGYPEQFIPQPEYSTGAPLTHPPSAVAPTPSIASAMTSESEEGLSAGKR